MIFIIFCLISITNGKNMVTFKASNAKNDKWEFLTSLKRISNNNIINPFTTSLLITL